MKISIKKMICMVLALSMILLLAGCKSNTDADDSADAESQESEITMEDVMEKEAEEAKDYDNGIAFEEEDDGAEIIPSKKDTADFVGSWTATSGNAIYQYGNVDIEVKDGGKWSGNISDEDLSGKWTETDEGLHLASDLFTCDLMFTKDGVLVMRYSPDDNGEYLTTVLTKK